LQQRQFDLANSTASGIDFFRNHGKAADEPAFRKRASLGFGGSGWLKSPVTEDKTCREGNSP
jgi:hypothetical protein